MLVFSPEIGYTPCMFGWVGKILEIDIDNRQSTILSPSTAYYHQHLGGKGIAGSKKFPEIDALTMAYKAVQEGAAGVDMGHNIFQSDAPVAMPQAVGAVAHNNETSEKALELYQTLEN